MQEIHSSPALSAKSNCVRTRLDEQLVSAAQAGSAAAFAELRNLYSQRIYRTIFAITKNREDAEDALQETFLRAYVALKGFEGRANFSSWLTRIAINSSLMVLRKRRARPEVSLNHGMDNEEDFAQFEFKDTALDPEQSFDQHQRQAKLMKAIGRLAPTLRDVVEVRMMRECTVKETARILDISEAAAKSRLYRARTRLTASRALGALTRRHFSGACATVADELCI